jgi:hypothetical protein
MIISHKHKFIFFKSKKTASTSIEVSLASVCGEGDTITPISREGLAPSYKHPVRNEKIFFDHIRPKRAYKYIDKTTWKNYTKIMSIRNPWDMVISEAFMRKEQFTSNTKAGLWKERARLGLPMDPTSMSLKDVLRKLLIPWQGPPPLWRWANLGEETCIDFFIRFENLNKDFSELCQRLNIDPIKLPFANGNYRTENKHYTEYYDNETRELVAKYYKKDIEMFEYEFED